MFEKCDSSYFNKLFSVEPDIDLIESILKILIIWNIVNQCESNLRFV